MSDDILARFDAQVRANPPSEPGTLIERTRTAVRVSGSWNCILYSSLTAATADSEIALQQAFFQQRGEKVEWKLYGHDVPADLAARLQRAGFQAGQAETLLLFDLRAQTLFDAPPPGVEIRRVSDADGLADVASVGEQAFGVDPSDMNADFLKRLPLGTVSFYVAYKGGEPISAARLEMPPESQFAGLYGGGTVPAHRRQGIYRSLVGARAREAANRGYDFLTVDAADTSLGILRRLGFMPLTTVRAWVWEPA